MYNPFNLTGKTILVTGASSGIGRAIAVEAAKLGATLVITGRNQSRLDETFKSLEGDGHSQFAADLADTTQIDKLTSELPHLDGCVNSAGIAKTLMTQFINRDALEEIMGINLYAPILLTRSLLKGKKLNRNSSLVFISSIAGVYTASPGHAMYSASKGAVQGFVKNAALDLAAKGIRVNSVNPGMINTSMADGSAQITIEQFQENMKKYPLKRFGEPEEVAYAVIYLLSDAAKWVTGTSLVIDGGVTII